MLPSSSNPAQPKTSDQLTPSPSQASGISGMNTEHMFRLIDSILPFEACLYYQFLPIALEGRYLRLGMVSPHDSSALDYARHILAYLNCSLKTEQITAEVHQSLLSAYLNYTRTSSNQKQASKQRQKVAHKEQPNQSGHDSSTPQRELMRQSEDTPIAASSSQATHENNSQIPSTSQTQQSSNDLPEAKQQELEVATSATALTPTSKVSPSVMALPPLNVKPLHLCRPMEFIATLAPQQMWHELLGRALIGGIGRLYFERQPDGGRILWSQEGVLQPVLEGLTLSVFQGLMMELKLFLDLPLLPVKQPKQVEVERRYQQECVLLRLRVMPGTHGEEAKLQVVRGVALKFYQRQQLEKLGQDALKLTQQLQRKLDEIRDRSERYSTPLEALPALNQLLQNIDKQLEEIAQLPMNQPSDN